MIRTPALVLALLLPVTACGGAGPAGDARAVIVIRTDAGTVRPGPLEVALTPEAKARGLMGRASLGRDRGMVFLYDAPTRGAFWMKDTLIPLSIAFWDQDGRIVDILDMEPCPADPCPLYASAAPYVGAVEMNRGWFAEHAVEVGDAVEVRLVE